MKIYEYVISRALLTQERLGPPISMDMFQPISIYL